MEIGGENAVPWAGIEALDLGAVKAKLMDPKRGKGWSAEQADRALNRYRRFLFLAGTTDEPVVPTEEIDEVWHTHILHTRVYAEVCRRLFGRFVHHAPTAPNAPEHERARLRAEFARTAELYEATFGEEYRAENPGDCEAECGIRSCEESCTTAVCDDDDVRADSARHDCEGECGIHAGAEHGTCDGGCVASCDPCDAAHPSPAPAV